MNGIAPPELAQIDAALRRAGYDPEWETACEGSKRIDALPVERCDLVILDGDAGALDCRASVRWLRECGCDLPLVVLSSSQREEHVIATLRAGADEWVEKAYLGDRLAGAVGRAFESAAVRRTASLAEQNETVEAEVSGALATIALELVAAWDTRMLFERLGQVGVHVLDCDGSSTLLLDSGGEAFDLVASFGWTAEEREMSRFVRAPRGAFAPILERLHTEDVVEWETKSIASTASASDRQLTHLCTALRQEGAVVGIQMFSRRDGGRPFTAAQRRIASGVADLASLSLVHTRMIDDLERAHRVKSDFVATVSHELRTPLHVVMGYTELLIDGTFGVLGDEQIQALQRISQRARGLLDLINATLDLNRLEAGRISVDVETTDLSRLMKGLHRETSEAQTNPNLRLVWEVPDRLPTVTTDPAKLQVALKNLIANALKFTDRGSVTVRARADENTVTFEVSDTGVGIAPEALPIVFEPFRQADGSSTRRFGGVGLGLYIVRRWLDLLGGRIEVESTLGKGSTFRVHLPLDRPSG